MSKLNRVVLVRHGETEGESSVRFHGVGDVALSAEGRVQMRTALLRIPGDGFDRVVSSRLQRAWQAAAIVAPGRAVALEPDFCEIDFGRWEGLTAEEIAERDPLLYREWQENQPGFDFPEGERREDFASRVRRGLARVLASGAASVLVVAHKGVVREIVLALTGQALPQPHPELGGVVQVTRDSRGDWRTGRRSSNPPGLGGADASRESRLETGD